MINNKKQSGPKTMSESNGFTAIELLITLFIAAMFLASGFQLYMVVIKDGGETRAQSNANNTLYSYLQQYKPSVTSPCTVQTPVNNLPITVSGISNVTITVSITCPFNSTSSISKVSASINYNNPQKTITNATFASPPIACPTGFIKVPGSSTYSTTDFCIMKYEAKNVNGTAVSQANGTPWVNIAQSDDINVSTGSTSTDPIITDGSTALNPYYDPGSGLRSVIVDLGSVKSIDTVKVWHYYGDGRTYYNTKTEVSTNNVDWSTIFDSATSGTYAETAAGVTRSFKPTNARYIRDWVNGSSINVNGHWIEVQAFSPTGGAIAASAAACPGCHLITEAEYMTIAQNVLSVASNWSGGTVGSGYIPRGNSNSFAAMDGTTDLTGVNKRTLTLTNGQVIWDLAGNVWELTSGVTNGSTAQQPGVSGASWNWREWTSVTANGSLAINPFPSGTGLSGSSTWNSTQDIGQIYSNSDDTSLRGFIRGGGWKDGSYNGVLALLLSFSPSDTHSGIGFRVSR